MLTGLEPDSEGSYSWPHAATLLGGLEEAGRKNVTHRVNQNWARVICWRQVESTDVQTQGCLAAGYQPGKRQEQGPS